MNGFIRRGGFALGKDYSGINSMENEGALESYADGTRNLGEENKLEKLSEDITGIKINGEDYYVLGIQTIKKTKFAIYEDEIKNRAPNGTTNYIELNYPIPGEHAVIAYLRK